jgi:hypothetical protein
MEEDIVLILGDGTGSPMSSGPVAFEFQSS